MLTRKELILKWLDNDLTPEEELQFSQLDDYEDLKRLTDTAKYFKAPSFDSATNYANLKSKLVTKKPVKKLWPNALKVASVIIIVLCTYFGFFHNPISKTTTQMAQQQELLLPDDSQVIVNESSTLTYRPNTWDDERTLNLNGEAYFKVTKGNSFTVKTPKGKVTVLGTEFNVKYRNNSLEVTCYEGLVSVSYQNINHKIPAGKSISISTSNSVIFSESIVSQAQWLERRSVFNNIKLELVLQELKNQYEIIINTEGINLEERFTGAFGHTDLETSLKSITQPMQLGYSIDGKTISLYEIE